MSSPAGERDIEGRPEPGEGRASAPRGLRQLLDEARAVLLEALTGLTERDFAADAGGVSVTRLLADLAATEHAAIREARAAAGLEPRPSGGGGAATTRPLPPQVTHALAGTRYEARILLEALGEEAIAPDVARLLLEGIAQRELEAAERIRARTIEG